MVYINLEKFKKGRFWSGHNVVLSDPTELGLQFNLYLIILKNK